MPTCCLTSFHSGRYRVAGVPRISQDTKLLATWHLKSALKRDPTDARLAMALGDVLSLDSATRRDAATPVIAAVAALRDALQRHDGDCVTGAAVPLAAGLRRLGAWLARHGRPGEGSVAVAAALQLDASLEPELGRSEL